MRYERNVASFGISNRIIAQIHIIGVAAIDFRVEAGLDKNVAGHIAADSTVRATIADLSEIAALAAAQRQVLISEDIDVSPAGALIADLGDAVQGIEAKARRRDCRHAAGTPDCNTRRRIAAADFGDGAAIAKRAGAERCESRRRKRCAIPARHQRDIAGAGILDVCVDVDGALRQEAERMAAGIANVGIDVDGERRFEGNICGGKCRYDRTGRYSDFLTRVIVQSDCAICWYSESGTRRNVDRIWIEQPIARQPQRRCCVDFC